MLLSASSLSCDFLLALVRSSPLPDLPPATSPRESELPSPASLWLPLPEAVIGAALPLPLLELASFALLPDDDDALLLPALA